MGEHIGYPWSGVRRRPSTISNFFSSETAWPIKVKFYEEPRWEGGMKVYINGPGHMTKMAAMPKVKFGYIGISMGKSENSGFFRMYSSQ